MNDIDRKQTGSETDPDPIRPLSWTWIDQWTSLVICTFNRYKMCRILHCFHAFSCQNGYENIASPLLTSVSLLHLNVCDIYYWTKVRSAFVVCLHDHMKRDVSECFTGEKTSSKVIFFLLGILTNLSRRVQRYWWHNDAFGIAIRAVGMHFRDWHDAGRVLNMNTALLLKIMTFPFTIKYQRWFSSSRHHQCCTCSNCCIQVSLWVSKNVLSSHSNCVWIYRSGCLIVLIGFAQTLLKTSTWFLFVTQFFSILT